MTLILDFEGALDLEYANSGLGNDLRILRDMDKIFCVRLIKTPLKVELKVSGSLWKPKMFS